MGKKNSKVVVTLGESITSAAEQANAAVTEKDFGAVSSLLRSLSKAAKKHGRTVVRAAAKAEKAEKAKQKSADKALAKAQKHADKIRAKIAKLTASLDSK